MAEPAKAHDGEAVSDDQVDIAIEMAGGARQAIRQLLDDCAKLQEQLAVTRLNVSAGWARGRYRSR